MEDQQRLKDARSQLLRIAVRVRQDPTSVRLQVQNRGFFILRFIGTYRADYDMKQTALPNETRSAGHPIGKVRTLRPITAF